jgi:hypothetical protein
MRVFKYIYEHNNESTYIVILDTINLNVTNANAGQVMPYYGPEETAGYYAEVGEFVEVGAEELPLLHRKNILRFIFNNEDLL